MLELGSADPARQPNGVTSSAPPLDRFWIAERLREVSDLVRLRDDTYFPSRTYRRAAETLEATPTADLERRLADGKLEELAFVGPVIAEQIVCFATAGRSELLDELRRELPRSLLEMARVRGLSLERAKRLHDALGVASVDDLQRACAEHRVRTVKGFGPKTEEALEHAVAAYRAHPNHVRHLDAAEIFDAVSLHLAREPAVLDIYPAGALRLVVVPFNIACGTCFFCTRELTGNCERTNPSSSVASGVYGYSHTTGGYDGGQAEFVRVPFADVGPMKIPDDMSEEEVLFLSDILPTGYHAAEMGSIHPGDTVVVFGCGPVGLFAQRSAQLLGAGRVIAVDHLQYRLDFAARYSGVETVNFDEVDDPVMHLLRMTDKRGADVCIDAVGCEAKGSSAQSLFGVRAKPHHEDCRGSCAARPSRSPSTRPPTG